MISPPTLFVGLPANVTAVSKIEILQHADLFFTRSIGAMHCCLGRKLGLERGAIPVSTQISR